MKSKMLNPFIPKFFKLARLYGNLSVENFDKKCHVAK